MCFLDLCLYFSSCGGLDILLAMIDCLNFHDISYCLVIHITTTDIRTMTSKTTTMKFKMENDEWMVLYVRANATIILCLSDEVLYNVINEKISTCLWYKLESLYMTKSLSNKFLLKNQLYCLRIKEKILILQHLNAFNKILSDLLLL